MSKCPECGKELKSGIPECPHCNSAEAASSDPEFVEHEEIFSTVDQGDIAFIKSLLSAYDITFYFQGEHGVYVGIYLSSAKLMVRKDQVEEAKKLLKPHYRL